MSDGLRGYVVVNARRTAGSRVGWSSTTEVHHEVIVQVSREINRRNPMFIIMTELQDWA